MNDINNPKGLNENRKRKIIQVCRAALCVILLGLVISVILLKIRMNQLLGFIHDPSLEVNQAVYEAVQGNMNTIYSGITILLTVFAIIVIVIPIIINKKTEDLIEKFYNELNQTNDKIKNLINQNNDALNNSLEKTKKAISNETQKIITDNIGQLDTSFNELKKKVQILEDNRIESEIEELKKKYNALETRLNSTTEKKQTSKNIFDKGKNTTNNTEERNNTTPEEKNERLTNLNNIIKNSNGTCSYDIYLKRGLIYIEMGKFKDALPDFREALQKNPFSADAYYYLSDVVYRNKDYENAWINIEKAIAINPNEIEYYKKRFEIYMKLGLYEEARKNAEEKGLKSELYESEKALAEDYNAQTPIIPISVGNSSFNMIYVEGGSFSMGATKEQGLDSYDDEKPVHRVLLNSYYIAEKVVSKGLWANIRKEKIDPVNKEKPATDIELNDINQFIRELNRKTGRIFRLPTEAEWEYAARGGNRSYGYKYSGSHDLKEVAYYFSTQEADKRKPNELGIYDMSGNVWEWCADTYGPYQQNPQVNPRNNENDGEKICRGGSWFSGARRCRVSHRRSYAKDYKSTEIGFRLVMEI